MAHVLVETDDYLVHYADDEAFEPSHLWPMVWYRVHEDDEEDRLVEPVPSDWAVTCLECILIGGYRAITK